ncbi:MAG: sulfatase-like hydrolase/transferase [Thermoanaerobaculia bacterium]
MLRKRNPSRTSPRWPARALAGSLLLSACGGAPQDKPAAAMSPPVILISIDTLRSDRLPQYNHRTGPADLVTPAIERLAHDGLLFEHAFAEVPLTLPSHTSILTGDLPPVHGVRDNIGFAVDSQRTPLLQQRLRDRGYATGAAVSAEVLAKRTGIAAGFDLFDEPSPAANGGAAARTAERAGAEAVRGAIGFLAGAGSRPFFLFLHLYEPHAPYRPPEPFRSRYRDPYDGEIATADALVADLLAELDRRGLYNRSLIVLLSDHGEGLGDHGEDEHGLLLYREALQVPLIVKLPGAVRAGERVQRDVGLIDVVPTVLEVLGLPAEKALPGISLLAKGEAAPPADRAIYSETMYPLIHFGWSDLASIVSGNLHLIDGLRPEVFDFVQDPGERQERSNDERRALAAMRRELAGIDRTLAPPAPADAETVAALGALGYLGTQAPSDRSQLDDPRDKIAGVAPVLRGLRLYNEGDYRAAIDVLLGVTGKDTARVIGKGSGTGGGTGGGTPDAAGESSALAWQYLGASYDALGKKAEALAAYKHGMSLAGSSSYLAETAALRLLELGRPQAAADLVVQELTRHPDSGRLRVLQSRALLQLGRISEAARVADEAVAKDSGMADAFYQRAVVSISRKDGLAAIDDLVIATRLDAKHIEARKALAMLRHAQGDDPEARRLLGEVLAIDPADKDARADLGSLDATRPRP